MKVLLIYRDFVNISNFYQSELLHVMQEAAEAAGVHGQAKFSHYHVLCELYSHGSLTLTEIAAKARVTLPNVSAIIDDLVNMGVVERNPDKQDRRKTHASITELGKRYGEEIMKRNLDAFNIMYRDEDSSNDLLENLEDIVSRINEHNSKVRDV